MPSRTDVSSAARHGMSRPGGAGAHQKRPVAVEAPTATAEPRDGVRDAPAVYPPPPPPCLSSRHPSGRSPWAAPASLGGRAGAAQDSSVRADHGGTPAIAFRRSAGWRLAREGPTGSVVRAGPPRIRPPRTPSAEGMVRRSLQANARARWRAPQSPPDPRDRESPGVLGGTLGSMRDQSRRSSGAGLCFGLAKATAQAPSSCTPPLLPDWRFEPN